MSKCGRATLLCFLVLFLKFPHLGCNEEPINFLDKGHENEQVDLVGQNIHRERVNHTLQSVASRPVVDIIHMSEKVAVGVCTIRIR